MRKWQHFAGLFLTLLLLSGLTLSGTNASGSVKDTYPILKTASPFSKTVQAVSGFTPMTGWMANRLLRKELSRYVKGDLHSQLQLFSGSDLLSGKARALRISGKNVLLDGQVPLSEFSFETDNTSALWISKESRPILQRPATFKLSAVMTADNMNHLLQSEAGKKMLTGVKVYVPPFGEHVFDVAEPGVKIDGDKLMIQSLLNTHGAPPEKALPIQAIGQIKPDGSRLGLSNLDLNIEGIQDTQEIARLIENYFGEMVNFNHIKVARHKVNVQVVQSDLKDNKLYLSATMTVTPKPKKSQQK